MNWDTANNLLPFLESGVFEFCLIISATFYSCEKVIDFLFSLLGNLLDLTLQKKRLNNSLTCNRVEKEQEGSTSR